MRLCRKICQFVAKILYFTSYFRLFKYTVSFPRYFTVCVTYQPPLVYCTPPKFSRVMLPEHFFPQMLHHQARRISESETVPYKKLIRQRLALKSLEPELAKPRSLSTRLHSL